MSRKRAAKTNIGIDLDERVIAHWRMLDRPDVTLIHSDALDVLPTLDLRGDDLVYCDPPYLPDTRRRPRVYRYDYDVADHERLIGLLRGLTCRIVLSGYQSPLYADLLSDWHRTDFPARTHAGLTLESAWTNFRPGDVLHDYSFVGDDFREREQLRRRIRTLATRLAEACPIERNAALAILADVQPDAFAAAARRLR